MLEELRISGLGVIDEASLALGPGLTVLTGETGAGKTMLVTALLLLFGGRSDSARIRTGSTHASVDGRLALAAASPLAQRVTDAGGTLDEDGTLVLRRVLSANGRSRAFVGGAPAPVALLSELAERTLAVHGQSDQLRLIHPSQHRAALDRYAGIDLDEYTAAFQTWRVAVERLADRTARARELRREADLLTHGIADIQAADPQPDEDVELAAEASRLAHADGLRLAARGAHDLLLGDSEDPGAEEADVTSLLGQAHRLLSQQAGADAELDGLSARLDELLAAATDLGAELASYRDHLDADPERLAQIESRRAVLAALIRRYGEDLPSVLEWAETSRKRLDELDVSDEALAALAAERDAAAGLAAMLAADISARRRVAASKLAEAVTAELAGLAMASARVDVQVGPRATVAGLPVLTVDGRGTGAGPDGTDDVEIKFAPHAGSPALALGKGASGGELSRVMLAIEVCLAGTDPVPTMVFDEVDAGVGGRAATEVGRRLAMLARAHQVIVVTHLAQVAAFADRHVVVDKPVAQAGITRSDVRIVEGQEREIELARMLAGSESATARRHAAELLASAVVPSGRPASSPAKRARSTRNATKSQP